MTNEELAERIAALGQHVDQRLDVLAREVDVLGQRVDNLAHRVNMVEGRVKCLDSRMVAALDLDRGYIPVVLRGPERSSVGSRACRMTRATAVVLIAIAAGAGVQAQPPANASLRPVQSGSLFSSDHELQQREMCLRGGTYVLAFERGPELYGFAVVRGQDADQLAVRVALTDVSEARWAWGSFTVDGPTCFDLHVINGQSAVYSLRIGVYWGRAR